MGVKSDDHVMAVLKDTPFGLVYMGCRRMEYTTGGRMGRPRQSSSPTHGNYFRGLSTSAPLLSNSTPATTAEA